MAKSTTLYVCDACGADHAKWQGKCDKCGAWNTLKRFSTGKSSSKSSGHALETTLMSKSVTQKEQARYTTGMSEVDEVLGGGIMPGSIVLLAGEPGIGKSTILLQVAQLLAKDTSTLYISAEESADQIISRSRRLSADAHKLALSSSTSAEDIIATISSANYKVVIVDSIQTIALDSIPSAPGSVSQITSSAHEITKAAKAKNISVIIVGHVTKDGNIAGPKLLEHIVDVVLQLEGDRYGGFKVLRSVKNRYGSTNEVGIFEMIDKGLVPVANPSQSLLEERQESDGSVVLSTIEGSRALLVEVQALVSPTQFGYPKRTASGFDLNRLNVLIAMLARRTKLSLADKDVFVNIVGGIRLSDPAADLAICLAIGSATKGLKLADQSVVFGEVGLSGEVRHVRAIDKRVKEAKKLGFQQAIGPNLKKSDSFVQSVSTVKEALNNFIA